MNKLRRRTFLRWAISGAAAPRLLIAPGAITTTTALAAPVVDPVTAMTIAKTGFDLYRMAQGGGGRGIASLLMAQTEMLRAISAQLSVVNEGIQELLAGVEALKNLVRELPSETVRAIVATDVRAAFTNLSEKFDRFSMLRERYGHSYALEALAPDSIQNILTLENRRAALMGDRSPLVIPLLCACWYVEFQALATLVPFERERILSVARSYQRWVESIEPAVAQLLKGTDDEAKALFDRQRAIAPPARCYSRLPQAGETVAQQDPYGYPVVRVYAQQHELALESPSEEPPLFSAEFDRLASADIQISEALRHLRPPSLKVSTTRISATGSIGGPGVVLLHRFYQRVDSAPCDPPQLIAKLQRLQQDYDLVAMKAVSHYHFSLALREARASIDGVIKGVLQSS